MRTSGRSKRLPSAIRGGVLKRIDYESLQINAANIQSQLNQLQSQYKEQLAYFKYQLGLPADAAITIRGRHQQKRTGSAGWRLPAMDQGRYSPVPPTDPVKRAGHQKIKSEKGTGGECLLPFQLSIQYNSASDAFKNEYLFKSSTVGISTTIPLFDGHRRKKPPARCRVRAETTGVQT